MTRRKYSKKFKLEILKQHTEEGKSFYQLEKENGISFGQIRRWMSAYKTYGEDGLEQHNSMLFKYSADFKQQVVDEYLAGGISAMDLACKYGILAQSTIITWVKQYNSREELTDSRPEGGHSDMAKNIKSRATTHEERVTIVEYCIANGNDYAGAAVKYGCSYGQVYSWVRKYNQKGMEGLKDGRGRNKAESEMTEVEKLKAENRLLKAEKKRQQMEIELLKKLEDIERR